APPRSWRSRRSRPGPRSRQGAGRALRLGDLDLEPGLLRLRERHPLGRVELEAQAALLAGRRLAHESALDLDAVGVAAARAVDEQEDVGAGALDAHALDRVAAAIA